MSLISFKIICQCVSWRDALASSVKNRLNAETIGAGLGAMAARRGASQPCEPHKGLTGGGWEAPGFPWRGASAPGVNPALQMRYLPSGSLKRNERVSAQNQIFFWRETIGCAAWECVKTCKSLCHTAKPWELAALTAIQCTYTCSALLRWLVLSQMEHLRSPLGGSDGRKSTRDTRESKAEETDANLLAKLTLPK